MAAPQHADALAALLADTGALCAVLSFLEAVDLARCCCVCTALRAAGASNALWAAACARDWADKVPHGVAACARAALAAARPREAFQLARADARRVALSPQELCALPWRFRFKAAAGEDWVARDPYHAGRPATRVRFHPNGRVQRLPPDAENAVNAAAEDAPIWPDVPIEWRWARLGAGVHATSPPAARGSLLRCRVLDRAVPTYRVFRHVASWGFFMESCWGLYTSFEPPRPGVDPTLDDTGLEVSCTPELQWREAHAYNEGVPLDEDDFAEGVQLAAEAARRGRVPVVPVGDAPHDWRTAPHDRHNGDAMEDAIALTVHGPPFSHVALLTRREVRALMVEQGFGVPAAGLLLPHHVLAGRMESDSEEAE